MVWDTMKREDGEDVELVGDLEEEEMVEETV